MSQPNRKYKRLEALLSETRPADPNPASRPVHEEVDVLKARIAALEAALEENKTGAPPNDPAAQPVSATSRTPRSAVKKMPDQPPAASRSENSMLSDAQRRRNMGLLSGFLGGIAFLASIFYVVIYLQTGVWQILAEAGFILLAMGVLVGVAYPLIRRNKFREASTWIMVGISIAFASPELVWENATTQLLVTGMLLLFVLGTTYPPQPMAWLIVPSLYIVYMFAANLFEPLPRFDINQSPIVNIFISSVTVVIGFWVIWQLYMLILRFSREESVSDQNLKQAHSEGKGSFRFGQTPFWRAVFRLLVEPDDTVAGVEPRRQAQLLTTLLVILIPLNTLGLFFRASDTGSIDVLVNSTITLALIAAYGLSRTRRYATGAVLTVTALTVSIFISFLSPANAETTLQVVTILFWLTLPLVIGSVILPVRSLAIYLAGNVFIMIAFAFIPTVPSGSMSTPIIIITIASIFIYFGRRFRELVERENQAEVISINEQLESSRMISQTLNQNLFLAADISRRLSQIQNLTDMLTESAETIRANFDLYYVQVYLTNPKQTSLILQAGTGSVGAELLRRGHRLGLDITSINGRAVTERRAVIVSDTADSAFFRPNPLLPDTRSEMAVPLMVGDNVVGVLDLQSREPATLTQDVLPAFEALAGQMAIAIQNSILFKQSEEARRQVEETIREIATTGWMDFLDGTDRGEKIGYVFDQTEVKPLEPKSEPRAANALNVPITVTGATVGSIVVAQDERQWTSSEAQVVQSAAEQLAQHIENLRLLARAEKYRQEAEQTARRLTREGWEGYLQARSTLATGYSFHPHEVKLEDEALGFESPSTLSLPITVRDEAIGELMVNTDNVDRQSMEEIFSVVAAQLGDHIENLRLSEQIEKRAAELATVADLSATTSTVLNPDELLQEVVDLTKERFDVYHAHVYLVDESWNTLLLTAGAGEVGRQMVEAGHSIQLDAERSLVARASRERKSVIVNDVRSEAGFLPNPLLPETRSEMAVPMIVGDKVIGVFDVQADTAGHFTDEDANIYTTLAAQVAVALQNARLYEEQAAIVTQLRELDRLKSSFLANMSHELRTPLNSILGFADVILEGLDGPLTDSMNNDLGLIQKNGQHLLHLINDVLDMAKIDSGKMNLNVENFNVHELLTDVTNITSSLAKEKSLELVIEPDSDQEVEIHADKIRLRQVMINLVNNAMKFTEQGRVSLRVQRENDNVLISVKDTGIGISLDQLETVFQEFTQVDTTTTRKTGGTGLGLPISRRLISMHSGRLWAESTGINGEGSTFHVTLPIEANIKENASLTAA